MAEAGQIVYSEEQVMRKVEEAVAVTFENGPDAVKAAAAEISALLARGNYLGHIDVRSHPDPHIETLGANGVVLLIGSSEEV